MEKAEALPREIKWHFIGGLQSSRYFHLFSPSLLAFILDYWLLECEMGEPAR